MKNTELQWLMRKYVSKLSLPWAGLTPKTPWFPKVESSSWNHPSLLSSLFWRPHQILCRLCPRSLARTSSLAESRAPLTHPGMQLFKVCIQHSVRWFQGMPFKYFGSTSPVSSRGRRWGPLVQWRARNAGAYKWTEETILFIPKHFQMEE